MAEVRYVMFGGVTLDDIVLPSGQVHYGVPGGNAVYAAIGAKVWCSEPVGVVSRIGADYPEEHLDRLRAAGIDLSGVLRVEGPSLHLWVLYEPQGRRQVIRRLDSAGPEGGIDPAGVQMPAKYLAAQFVHLSGMSLAAQQAVARYLDERGKPFSLDNSPMTRAAHAGEISTSFALERCQAFLPSIEEVEMIWGSQPLAPLLRTLAGPVPRAIAVKMGSRGSLVYDPGRGQVFHVPGVPVQVADATGAGDAYCGGFVAGYGQSRDAVEAAMWGAVSASFVIQGLGALHALHVERAEALRRLEWLRGRVEEEAGSREQ